MFRLRQHRHFFSTPQIAREGLRCSNRGVTAVSTSTSLSCCPFCCRSSCTLFLDLVLMGHGPAASALYTAHAASFLPTHTALLSQIRSLALPSHIQSDPLAQRFRSERYVRQDVQHRLQSAAWLADRWRRTRIRLDQQPRRSRSTRSTWKRSHAQDHQREVSYPGALGSALSNRCCRSGRGDWTHGCWSYLLERHSRRISTKPDPRSIAKNAVSQGDALAEFNARAAGPQLKLHPSVPLTERLETEVQKELQEVERREKETAAAVQADQNKEAEASSSTAAGAGATQEAAAAEGSNAEQRQDGDTTMQDASTADGAQDGDAASRARTASVRPSEPPTSAPGTAPPTAAAEAKATGPDFSGGLLAASITDLPPQAPTFRTVDVKREVQRIRDARKRIRLDPSLLNGSASTSTTFTSGVRDSSINALGEQGAHAARVAALPSVCAYTSTTLTTASPAPPSPTTSRSWRPASKSRLSKCGRSKAKSFEVFVQPQPLFDPRQPHALSTTRDRILLDASVDRPFGRCTASTLTPSAARPLHLDTCSAVPPTPPRACGAWTRTARSSPTAATSIPWDIKWSPIGTYFATASADKTARLWSTERVNPLRMYGGICRMSTVSPSIRTVSTFATGSSTAVAGCGTCNAVPACACSSVTSRRFPPQSESGWRYLASAAAGMGTASQFAGVDGVDPTSKGAHINDVSISLWDLASGRRIKKMWGHQERIYSMDFSAMARCL